MKKILSLLLSISMIFSCVGVAQAREIGEKKTYIVVLDAPAVYSPDRVTFYGADDNTYRKALLELQAEIKSQINGGMSAYSLRNPEKTYTYTDVICGFTVNVDAATAESIKKIDGVKAVVENEMFSLIEPVGEETLDVSAQTQQNTQTTPADISTGNMMNAQTAYDKGYDGEGRVIAVLDTAILPEHAYYSLTDESKVRYTQNDVGAIIEEKGLKVSATAEEVYYNPKIPFAYNYADDSTDVSTGHNHGGHVAGIAAGYKTLINDEFYISGVAPEAQIMFFGVFDKTTGMAAADVVIAALEDAIKFDIDAINLSLGRSHRSENYDESVLFDEVVANAENAGISVIYAAGNAHRGNCIKTSEIDYSTADNRSYLTTSKVGSVMSEYVNFYYLEDNLGNKYKCVSNGRGAAFDMTEFVYCYGGTADNFNSVDLSGKVAFVVMPHKIDSPASIGTYYTRAVSAGAAAVVIAINTNNDLSYGSLTGATCPVLTVTKITGQRLLNSGAASLKFANAKTTLRSDEAGSSSDYSSYGYADNLDISVDFAAPGGNVLSAALVKNGYEYKAGTSMATPHVTGATTLMHQYVESAFPVYTGVTRVRLIKKLLASTAKTVYEQNGAIASPRKVGAGIVDLDAAMNTSIYLTGVNSDYTRINLGEDLTNSFTLGFEAHNLSEADVAFDSAVVELSSDEYYTSGNVTAFDGIRKLTATVAGGGNVTVPAKGMATVSLNVTLSDADVEHLGSAMTNGFFIDGKVTLSGEDNCDVGIPFSGFYGDWARQPIMTENRFLNYFSISGYSDDGFTPPAMLKKTDNQLVMPMSDSPDVSVAGIPAVFFANPQRNAFVTIKCDGVTVVENAFVNKLYDTGYYIDELSLGDLSEVSTIVVELRLPLESQPSHIYTINLVEDNVAPVISDVYVGDENGTDYTYITVSDNYGIGTVTSAGEYAGNRYYSDVYMQETSATVAFDITDLNDLHYYVYDCAFNMTALTPHIGIDVKDNVATYTNNTHNNLTGECMIAVYEGSKMVDFKKLSESAVTIEAYDTTTFDVSAYSGKSYKLFFWSDMKNVIPICDAYEK